MSADAGTDLGPVDVDRTPSWTFDRPPVWDTLNPRQKELLKLKSPNVTDGELAQAVELAAAYQLDPYANEIWFAKSKTRDGRPGKLLIMVGRDGLRKIAQRNGLSIDGDVVRANDHFRVARSADRQRLVEHTWEDPANRGDVIGAWAEAWDRHGRQRGFFYAPVSEYKPSGASDYSPWSKQESVMILAAAERQAARQATPLGGLLVEGEDDVINATAVEAGTARQLDAGEPLDGRVEAVVARAQALGHDGLGDRVTAHMATAGQADEVVEAWVRESNAILDALEERGGEANPTMETGEGLERPAEDAAVARAPVDVEADIRMAIQDARQRGDQQALDAALAELQEFHEREKSFLEPEGLTPEEEQELERLHERLAAVRTDPELADGADEIQGQIDALEARRQPGLF